VEASLADSGTQWHACLTIVGNRKLKIKSFFYNALGRVPSRARAGSWQAPNKATRKEASWREDHRRISNGDQVHMISGLAMKRGPSMDFCGYWQRGSDDKLRGL
jgi:hypothetical protein